MLPHTNIGVASRDELARLREVTASQGLMLESINPDLVAHQGSPTKHPARRLDTIRAAGELRIPFTSGILVGIGESLEERIGALEALAAVHAEYGHLQEVILQNFVPHPRYYGAEPAEIADEVAGRTGDGDGDAFRCPRGPPTSRSTRCACSSASRKRLMPDVGVQIPPNLSDWWLPLVEEGATDLGGLSANGDHISPEHPFPSPHRMRKQLQPRGLRAHRAALRLPAVHGPRVARAGRARRHQGEVLELHPAPRVGPPRGARDPPRPGARARSRKGRDGGALTPDELTALFAETRPEAIEDMRQAADELRAELAGDTVTFVVNRNINISNVCIVGCAFCGFGQGRRSPDAYEHDRADFERRVEDALDYGATEICMQSGIHPDWGLEDYEYWLRVAKEVAPDIHMHAYSAMEVDHMCRPRACRPSRSSTGCARRASTRRRARPPRCSTTACASGSRRTSCRSRAGSRSSRRRTPPGCARPRPSCSATSRSRGSSPSTCASCARSRSGRAASPSSCRCRSSRSTRCSAARTASRRSRARRTSSTPPSSGSRSGRTIPNLQASWVKMGLDAATEALRWGVNDLGGTLMEESISRMAGSYHGVKLDPDDLVGAAHAAGRPAAQRDTLYRVLATY